MRKLSTLIAMILCVTIGGVYAAWAYSNPDVKMTDATAEIYLTMDDAKQDGAQGEFSAEANFKIKIDPLRDVDPTTNEENANHKTAIAFYGREQGAAMMNADEAIITITFRPNASADGEIKANGPTSYYYLIDSTELAENGAAMSYKGTQIFNYTATKANPVQINWGTPAEDGTFTVTLKAKDLIGMTTFYLEDIEAHKAFQACLAGNIKLVVTETNPAA